MPCCADNSLYLTIRYMYIWNLEPLCLFLVAKWTAPSYLHTHSETNIDSFRQHYTGAEERAAMPIRSQKRARRRRAMPLRRHGREPPVARVEIEALSKSTSTTLSSSFPVR
uniref:Uncharacterized protein n=1 Tax=Oryza rufipogon TaxID=4529 RepID=A0A0E0RD90_ORYRU